MRNIKDVLRNYIVDNYSSGDLIDGLSDLITCVCKSGSCNRSEVKKELIELEKEGVIKFVTHAYCHNYHLLGDKKEVIGFTTYKLYRCETCNTSYTYNKLIEVSNIKVL